jgi:hypothetical protein
MFSENGLLLLDRKLVFADPLLLSEIVISAPVLALRIKLLFGIQKTTAGEKRLHR